MALKSWFLLLSMLLVLLAVVGCGGAPATPTKPPVTVPPAVITVVVTATPPPATPTSAQPTAVPTPTITATVPVTTPVASKPTSVAVKAATRTPTKGAAAATAAPTALPVKFAAPRLLEPIFDLDQGKKDERHFPGDALIFKWTSVGGLGTDECYDINVSMTPGQADSFLTACGDQTQQGSPVANASFPGSSFTLYQPSRGGPNYSALLPYPNADTWVTWSVRAVKDLGKGNGPQDANGVRHNTAALGAASSKGQFLLKGQ